MKSTFAASLVATCLVAAGLAIAQPAHAAELKILAAGALPESLGELAPRFERVFGHKLNISYAAAPGLIKQATSGAPFDLAIVPLEVMKDEAARTHFAAGPTTDIARVGFGVGVRAGATKPEVGTPDALKQALLAAKSITFFVESVGGVYITSVFERLGIGAAMKAKTRPQTAAGQIAAAIARGDAELGVDVINGLMAPGVDFAGPLPPELQRNLVFTGAIAADTKQAEAVKDFIKFLKTPESAAVFKAKGIDPG